jgi:glycosyltransferase involved in cell wall biosynthesis
MERFRLSSHTISVIYPPLPSFCFAKLNGRENPQGLPFAGQGPFFLSVGTLEPRKNLQRLIQGWRQTYTQCRIPLLLVGPYGWKEKKLKDGQSTVSDGLHWLGPVDDSTLTALYRQATAVIQYSLDEGFDYPVAEALCMGTPLIVSDIEVHREVTAGCALFAPPTAPEILAERLFELCSWPQEKKSECKMQARRQADLLRKFSAIDNYLTLYDRVLAAEE